VKEIRLALYRAQWLRLNFFVQLRISNFKNNPISAMQQLVVSLVMHDPKCIVFLFNKHKNNYILYGNMQRTEVLFYRGPEHISAKCFSWGTRNIYLPFSNDTSKQ
jgi:hypothetical protein